jgi:Domain of unknown function (DUF397)
MDTIDKSTTTSEWRKSSYSLGSDSTCVEVSIQATGVAVRDSKNPTGPVLLFTMQEWRVFLLGVRADEFDV